MKIRVWILGAGLVLGVASCMDVVAPAPPAAATHRTLTALADSAPAPQLLVCPTTETQQTTGLIGILGGVLSLGNMRVQIPLGAVLSPTLIQIVAPASQYMEVDVHAVGLTTLLFHRPVNITIDYSRCDPDAIPPDAQLQGVYIDTQSKEVLQEMGGVDNRAAHSITFSTGHLSGYAVAY